jgi:hypothetical protein
MPTEQVLDVDSNWRCQDFNCKGWNTDVEQTHITAPWDGYRLNHGGWTMYLDGRDVQYWGVEETVRRVGQWLLAIHRDRLDFLGQTSYPEQEAMHKVLGICGIGPDINGSLVEREHNPTG